MLDQPNKHRSQIIKSIKQSKTHGLSTPQGLDVATPNNQFEQEREEAPFNAEGHTQNMADVIRAQRRSDRECSPP